MSSSMLMPALVAIALVYGIQLVNEGRLFEGVLLMVVGILGGFYGEYLLQRWLSTYCDHCGSRMRNCDRCRRGKNLVELTKELAEYVGLRHVEALKFRLSNGHFAKYHTVKGHNHDLYHEYAIVLRKVV